MGVAVWSLPACANEMPPPGALPDDQPPRVERIVPGPDTVLTEFDGWVRIRFSEPVSVPSDLARRLVASPLETYEVQSGFSDLRLRPRNGWRDSVVYCLAIPEGITDLLRNRTETGIRFCFSTGVPIAATLVAGSVFDAVTGSPQNEATVIFLATPDSTPYGTVTNPEGRFSLRALPPDDYRAYGFMDRNRNYALDKALEPYDSATVSPDAGSEIELRFRLVEPDTTGPQLLRAGAVDSLTIELEFDDPLVRAQPGAAAVVVSDSSTGTPIPVDAFAVGQGGLAPPDTAGADPGAAADTMGAAPDTALAAREPGAGGLPGEGAGPPGLPQDSLPSPLVTVRVAEALSPGVYLIRAEGFVNLRGLEGGGETSLTVEAAEEPGAVADTTGAAADTTEAATDTSGVAADTTGAAADTTGAVARRRGRVPDMPVP